MSPPGRLQSAAAEALLRCRTRAQEIGRYILHPAADRRKLEALEGTFRRLVVDRSGCRKPPNEKVPAGA